MKYRRAAIVADDWHGEFGSYDEWAALGPQPPYRTATFFDARGRRCITQHDFARARDDRAFPLRYRWERTSRESGSGVELFDDPMKGSGASSRGTSDRRKICRADSRAGGASHQDRSRHHPARKRGQADHAGGRAAPGARQT